MSILGATDIASMRACMVSSVLLSDFLHILFAHERGGRFYYSKHDSRAFNTRESLDEPRQTLMLCPSCACHCQENESNDLQSFFTFSSFTGFG